ncbi:MAG TPA: HlyD family efflux transporter periplasmic adaptor subunit [Acidobacteriota bacterium]|nr:HlyD family efflux transporter periplasmic adaptor subunit [Acidobacteriota bacterium]
MKKHPVATSVLILVLLVILVLIFIWARGSDGPAILTYEVVRQDIKVVVNTNGIIEPVDRSEVYAPIDGRIVHIPHLEGSEIGRGQLLVRLESERIRTALADARAGLLEARRHARTVLAGPPREEISDLDASIAESEMQLQQTISDLAIEESLLPKGATTRMTVESLRNRRDLLELRVDSLKQRKADLLARYSDEEKKWEQEKVNELAGQVEILEEQLRMETVAAPWDGVIFSLPVKPGASVARGQLLAQIYQPGRIRLRAYVDEPDLGRVAVGQRVLVEWDGLEDRYWNGTIEQPAKQVVTLGNRSIGHVLCSIEGATAELIPNLNVNVAITIDMRTDALAVPRSCVFSRNGKTMVIVSDGIKTTQREVTLGLVTAEKIEIIKGISEGDRVVMNPLEIRM